MSQDLISQIALSITPNIGSVRAKALVEHFGSAENVFAASKHDILSLENFGATHYNSIKKFDDYTTVDKEIAFIEKYKIQPLFIGDKNYPQRLRECYDPPTMLYYKGNADLNHSKVISIVGTRSYTAYGKETTEKIIEELAGRNILVVSGLAIGIDIIAHKEALKNGLPTVGVMGNGLKTIYPPNHKTTAAEMITHGGVLTELLHDTKPDKHNFPKRNRIVAGMSDATIVIETAIKGGSMITAEIANNYNRDVFAIPGRLGDEKSEGCNYLIQNNKAFLFHSIKDFLFMMGWNEQSKKPKKQIQLFYDLSEDEKKIVSLLKQKEQKHIDEIAIHSGFSASKLAATMLQLELQNIIKALPGKMYALA